MRTLVIDSATQACSVALFQDSDFLAGDYRELGRGHAEQLIPMIAALPDNGKADRIVVALGPGSFTGVRVGLAAAKALALVWQSELLGYSSLALIAAMARQSYPDKAVAAVITGGHGEWFVQRFDDIGRAVSPMASLTPEAARSEITEHYLAGSEAQALIALRGFGIGEITLPDARMAMLLSPSDFTVSVEPHYGRPPDARLPGADQKAIGQI